MTSGSATDPSPSARWTWLLLAAVLVWAGAVRVWMASSGLESGHYWDERYSVKNLRAVLEDGTLEPANYYYPSLSYLPQAAVLAAIEGASRALGEPFSFFADRGLHPTGYLIARLIQVVYSLATLLLAFLLGRRLISAEAGLIAALLLAVSPQHVRLSTMWKPDVTLLLAILLALWWSLDALERPTLGRYLLAGAGVGLALAAKLNGGPIAVPLTIGAAVAGFHDRRHWRGLVAAGGAAALVFTILNPHVKRYLDALERNQELYSRRTRGPDPTLFQRVLEVAREEAGFVLSTNFHGVWIGIAALAGLCTIGVIALRRRDRTSTLLALAVLAFPLAYTALYAASTPYAKENNFLQILPFTALAAAFLLATLWRAGAVRLPARTRPPAAAIAFAALALAVAAPTQAWVYRSQVPGTWEIALQALAERLQPAEGRVAYLETPRSTIAGQPADWKSALRAVDDLAAVPLDLLDQADAEVFEAGRLDGPRGELLRERAARADAASTARFDARWFRSRGPAVIALVHAREAAGRVAASTIPLADGSASIALPAGDGPAEGEWLSVELAIERGRARAPVAEPEVLLGERRLRLETVRSGRTTTWLTERFPSGAAELTARWKLPAEETRTPSVVIYRWK